MKKIISLVLVIQLGFSPGCFAKITQKELKEGEYEIIIIKKGDTLWDLAGKHIGKCWKWPEFKKYNYFTDPHWIYPGEKLAIGIKDGELVIKKWKELVKELKAEIAERDKELARVKEEIERIKRASAEKIDRLIREKEAQLARLEAEMAASAEKDRLITQLKEEIEALKLAKAAKIAELMAQQERERAKLEEEIEALKGDSELLKRGMEELARKLTSTEERLIETEQVIVKKEEEIVTLKEEKAEIATKERTQRRYKEMVAVALFLGVILVNSLR
jgi:predicted  nucleic acid-binding Zn-ribbon protein